MKKVALIAATEFEIQPTLDYIRERLHFEKKYSFELIITGAGLLSSTYILTKTMLQVKPELAIQAGIAGSFHPLYPPETVVGISSEIVGDSGVLESGKWRDLFELNLVDENDFPFVDKWLPNPHEYFLHKLKLPLVKAITVNEITTAPEQLILLTEKYKPITESMEGAALHFVCLSEKIPFVQMRAISNWVGERDKAKWKIKTAIENLNQQLIQFINHLSL